MERFARKRLTGLSGVPIILGLFLAAACAGEPAEEALDQEQETTAVTPAGTAADQEAEAPVRRWLPDEMSRSTRVENFPHGAHVEISCRVCHAAPQGHQMHRELPCAECHRSSALVTMQALAPSECMACHHSPERNVACSRCHDAPGPRSTPQTLSLRVWQAPRSRTFTFDHGLHGPVDCRTCHERPTSMIPTRTCDSCHERHHTPEARCQTCHEQPPASAHGVQAHLGCSGARCHAAPDVDAMAGRRAVCLVCHQAQENHEPGRECAGCHQVRPGGEQ